MPCTYCCADTGFSQAFKPNPAVGYRLVIIATSILWGKHQLYENNSLGIIHLGCSCTVVRMTFAQILAELGTISKIFSPFGKAGIMSVARFVLAIQLEVPIIRQMQDIKKSM